MELKFCNWSVRCQANTAGRFASFLPVAQHFSNNAHFQAAQRGRVDEATWKIDARNMCFKKKRGWGGIEVGTGARLPPSYITLLLPTLTNSLGTEDLCLPPAGLVTAVSLWSEGLCRLALYSEKFQPNYLAGLQSGHSRTWTLAFLKKIFCKL